MRQLGLLTNRGLSAIQAVMSSDDQVVRQVDTASSASSHDAAYAPIETRNLNQIISERLLGLIRSGAIQPGERLPSEKELMRRFGVGRSSVREALHSLVALHMLEARPGKGYFLSESLANIPSNLLADLATREMDYLHLMEAREALEIAIVRLAVKRATPLDLKNMTAIYEEIHRAAAEGQDITQYTGKIHQAMAEASHNPVFVRLLEVLMPLWPMKMMRRTITAEEHLRLHRRLIDGLQERNEEKIVKLMREHLATTREYYFGGALREVQSQQETTS